jgi:hypothetical protein
MMNVPFSEPQSFNAYWPINVMAGVNTVGVGGPGGSFQAAAQAVFFSAIGLQGWEPFGHWYQYLMAMSRYLNQLNGSATTGLVNRRPGTLYFSTGGFDSYGILGYALREINLGTTVSWSFGPYALSYILGALDEAAGEPVMAIQGNLQRRVGDLRNAANDPDQLGAILTDALDTGERA